MLWFVPGRPRRRRWRHFASLGAWFGRCTTCELLAVVLSESSATTVPEGAVSLLKASYLNRVLLVRWRQSGCLGALRLLLLLAVQAWQNPMGMVVALSRASCCWCGLGLSAPFGGEVASPPRRVLGAAPLAELGVKVRDAGGISVLQCPSMALAETPRSSGTFSRASFVSASLSRWSEALRLRQLHLLVPVRSWFASSWVVAMQAGGGAACNVSGL